MTPFGAAVDAAANLVLAADDRVRVVAARSGRFYGIAVAPAGRLLIAVCGGQRIESVAPCQATHCGRPQARQLRRWDRPGAVRRRQAR